MENMMRLQPMRPMCDAIDHDDNWTGLTDAKSRRRRQNRLNQRAYRRRRELASQFLVPAFNSPDAAEGLFRNVSGRLSTPTSVSTALSPPSVSTSAHPFTFPLSVDHLLTLVQFNVYRALFTNMTILALPNIFSCEEPEPQVIVSPIPLPNATPASLVPTPLQLAVIHEPWIDLFPLPALRDNILKAWGTFDTCELCDDVLGTMFDGELSKHDERNGVVVWGDPWDINSWELMEGFLKKWGWMLVRCEALLVATNRWRAMRGEELFCHNEVLTWSGRKVS